MDILTFISSLVDALAWPIAVVIILYLLREPIAQLLPLLSSLRYKDLELQFGDRLRQLDQAQLPQKEIRHRLPSDSERVRRLAELSPRAAVLESWVSIEIAALRAASILIKDDKRNKTFYIQAIHSLERSGKLADAAISMLRQLRTLRNQAAHAPEFAISVQSALDFADAADRLIGYLEFITVDTDTDTNKSPT